MTDLKRQQKINGRELMGDILSREEVIKMLERYEGIDYSRFYIDGELSLKRVIELGYGFLINGVSLDGDGKVIDFTLHGNTAGYVYLVKAANELVKIGMSADVKNRFAQLEGGSPVALELLRSAFVPDAPGLERRLHDMFAEKRRRGEWFALTSDDLKLALRILAENEAEG